MQLSLEASGLSLDLHDQRNIRNGGCSLEEITPPSDRHDFRYGRFCYHRIGGSCPPSVETRIGRYWNRSRNREAHSLDGDWSEPLSFRRVFLEDCRQGYQGKQNR